MNGHGGMGIAGFFGGAGLDEVRPGDPVRAEDYNRIVRVLRALLNVRGGHGITVASTSAGWTIAAAAGAGSQPRYECHLARIVNVRRTDGLPPIDPGLPADIRYDITLFGPVSGANSSGGTSPGGIGVIEDLLPRYGRPRIGTESEVYPASVGDLCWYLVTPTGDNEGTLRGDLWVISERDASTACGTV